jgi:ribosome-associated protein
MSKTLPFPAGMSGAPHKGLWARGLFIPETELSERFIHASGPGGQNVNKVASAVQLSFDVRQSPSLPEPVRAALLRLGGSRLSKDGVLTVTARKFREQERNRADARARLADLIRQAAAPKKPRRPTRVPKASKARRLEAKKRRGGLKKERNRPYTD